MTEINKKQNPEDTVVFSGRYGDSAENREITIPDGILEIAENAFRDFENLEVIRLPKSLKKISACAFSGCKNLRRVEMQFGIEEILDEAFSTYLGYELIDIGE